MTSGSVVRDSRILGVFDEILHNSDCDMRALEIAGRGISAEARCALVTLADKHERYDDTPELARWRRVTDSNVP